MAARADPSSTKEWSSQSNVEDAWATDLRLDLDVDFDGKTLYGYVEFHVEAKPGVKTFDLDTRNLDIHRVTVDGKETPVVKSEPHPVAAFGQKLEVGISGAKSKKPVVRVYYSTSPNSEACQWVEPAATAGKEHPYLFTQCQAIHARSLLPCQDAPAAKCPVSAEIRCPNWATALMSAILQKKEPGKFIYKQKQPIPSYLIAIAVGHLEKRKISNRVDVWAEPKDVDKAAYEFAETEAFLKKAEELMDLPYQWERYDILCMPPSFPYGGMENPCLTFVTPTLLAGDRSLADVVAHEIAHSWTGNVVTNHTWEHFWLNEGWTVWTERHIVSGVKGNDKAHFSFIHQGGWSHLEESVKHLTDIGNSHYTRLVPNLKNVDPDDSFSSVPYEKGFNLLYTMQKLVGDDRFFKFAKAYIAKFKFKTITSQQFKEFSNEQLPETKKLNWDDIFFGEGLPNKPEFDTSLTKEVDDFVDGVAKLGEELPDEKIWKAFSTAQKILALDLLIKMDYFDVIRLNDIKDTYELDTTQNSEVKFRYLQLCLRNPEASFAHFGAVAMATAQGRMKFTRPLFRSLALQGDPRGYVLADQTFKRHKDQFHPICRKMVEADLRRIELERQPSAKDSIIALCGRIIGMAFSAVKTYGFPLIAAYMAFRTLNGQCPIPFVGGM